MSTLDPALAATWTDGAWTRLPDQQLHGACHDTRTLQPGMLFVALAGSQCDGHAFIDDALAAGAAAALVASASTAADDPRPLLRVEDPHRALQQLGAAWRQELSPLIIGITGSSGKTTVKAMIAAMLQELGPTASTHGNWNNDIGLPLSLLAMDRETRFGVFEVGTSHPGEIAALCDILVPDWGVVTNIGPAHLEFFGSPEGVAAEKGVLLERLPEQGLAVLEHGPWYDRLRVRTGARVITTALEGDADLTTGAIDMAVGTVEIQERDGDTCVVPLPLPGRHQVSNLLQAVAVARAAGADWDAVITGLKAFRALPMRWDVTTLGSVHVVNDAYNANPASMRGALEALNDCTAPGRCWLVLGDMLELGATAQAEHESLGRTIGAGHWAGLVTVGPLAAHIGEGAEGAGMSAAQIFRCTNVKEAAEWLSGRVAERHWVLLKASRGMRLERLINELRTLRKGDASW